MDSTPVLYGRAVQDLYGKTSAQASTLPYEIVAVPSWVWRKLKNREVNVTELTTATVTQHLSRDELAEWCILPDVLRINNRGLFPSHVMDHVQSTSEHPNQSLRDLIAPLTCDPDLQASLLRKLEAPTPSEPWRDVTGSYEIVLTPGYMWVVVQPGFLYNVKLDASVLTELMDDVLTRLLAAAPLSRIAYSLFFETYVSMVGTD